MDANRFDHVARTLVSAPSRRALPRLALAGMLGALGIADAAAKKRKRRKKKKIKRNAFGCVNVGNVCKNAGQCCSGICSGKKGKKRCRAHDTGDCQAGQTLTECGGATVACTSSAGIAGKCATTTGNAAYCAGGAVCVPCTRDADCLFACGPAAACVVCEGLCGAESRTLCAGPEDFCNVVE